MLALYVEVPTILSPKTCICSFSYEWELCHWNSRRQRIRMLATAAIRRTEGSCPNRMLVTALPRSISQMILHTWLFLLLSLSNSRVAWVHQVDKSEWQRNMGNTIFIFLALVGWVDTLPGSQNGCWELVCGTHCSPTIRQFNIYIHHCFCGELLTSNSSNMLPSHNATIDVQICSSFP